MRVLFPLICLLSFPAFAQYHAGSSDCDPLTVHTPSADVEAKDGTDHRGNPIAPASPNAGDAAHAFDNTRVYLGVPTEDYLDKGNYNADLTESIVDVGRVDVSRDGTTKLNGKQIKPQNMYSTECK